MNRHSDSIALAEQRVAEARTAALAEYRETRANLRRRMGSPVFIGGVLLGVIALGYFAAGRGKPKRLADAESPGAWSRAVVTVQVLLPLLMALHSALSPARKPRANSSGAAR